MNLLNVLRRIHEVATERGLCDITDITSDALAEIGEAEPLRTAEAYGDQAAEVEVDGHSGPVRDPMWGGVMGRHLTETRRRQRGNK